MGLDYDRILEGVLSACYHLCPVDESFQFDTTFMYIIAVLIYSKLYQFRHPDTTPRAYTIFCLIAVMLIFEVVGYYVPPGWFMFFFLCFYSVCMILFYHKMYFQGDKEYKKKINIDAKRRKIFFGLIILMNIGLVIFFADHSFMKTSVISKYLLVIFGMNM